MGAHRQEYFEFVFRVRTRMLLEKSIEVQKQVLLKSIPNT